MENRRSDVRVDEDGVKTIRTGEVRGSVWIVAAALVALAVAFLLYRPGARTAQQEAPDDGRSVAPVTDPPPRAPPPAFKPIRRGRPAAEPPPAEESINEPVRPSVEAQPAEAPAAGGQTDAEPEGIALFPPPGTDPIKRGLIVPDDFDLPPGYVRHYQATDDGQRLPAILMFHPDYEWVDARGNPVEIPDDHVVPPEMAPAGLPLQTLDAEQPPIPMLEEPGDGETGD